MERKPLVAGRKGGSEKSQRDLENVLRKVGGKGEGLGQRTELLCIRDPCSPLISSPNRSLLGFKEDCYPETVKWRRGKPTESLEQTFQARWPPQRKWAIPCSGLLFTTPENLSRYAQHVSLDRRSHALYQNLQN